MNALVQSDLEADRWQRARAARAQRQSNCLEARIVPLEGQVKALQGTVNLLTDTLVQTERERQDLERAYERERARRVELEECSEMGNVGGGTRGN